jgi:hypothetical protein
MRRALAIVKYLPAALCALLVMAWVVSCFYEIGAIARLWPQTTTVIGLSTGNLFAKTEDRVWQMRILPVSRPTQPEPFAYLGRFYFARGRLFGTGYLTVCCCPLLFLSSLLFPLAIAPFTHFRFPLWSYFAWTALVAAELAYYLR